MRHKYSAALCCSFFGCWCVLSFCFGEPALAAEKSSAPEYPALKKAIDGIKELYEQEYRKTGPDDKAALAQLLLKDAADPGNDATTCYALLTESAHLAAEAVDIETTMKALAGLVERYKIDKLYTTVVFLSKILERADSLKGREQQNVLALLSGAFILLASEAVTQDAYQCADMTLKEAYKTARKSRSQFCIESVKSAQKNVRKVKQSYDAIAGDRERLLKNADDPQANLSVGKFLCFVKGDWNRGLQKLSKGSDKSLLSLAELELEEPEEAATRLKVGHGWWDLAEKETDKRMKRNLLRRSILWYEKALPDLGGISGKRIMKRIAEASNAADWLMLDPPWIRDAVLALSFNKETYFEKGKQRHAADVSGGENHGEVIGAGMIRGVAGEALGFDGKNDIVKLGDSVSGFPLDDFTLCLWVIAKNDKVVIGSSGSGAWAKKWFIKPKYFHWSPRGGRESAFKTGKAVHVDLKENRWNHVAVVRRGNAVRTFVNGALADSDDGFPPSKLHINANGLRIGGYKYDLGSKQRFCGSIDEVAIWRRALSEREIKDLFTYSAKRKSYCMAIGEGALILKIWSYASPGCIWIL